MGIYDSEGRIQLPRGSTINERAKREPKRQTGIWIKADGTQQTVQSKGKKFTLAELQSYVGGYIEHVQLKRGNGQATLWGNEEAKLDSEHKLNVRATAMAHLFPNDYFAGDALLVNPTPKHLALAQAKTETIVDSEYQALNTLDANEGDGGMD